MTGWDELKKLDVVRDSNWRIARETLDLEYRWDSERAGRTEIVDDGNSVEQIEIRIDVYYKHTHTHTHTHLS